MFEIIEGIAEGIGSAVSSAADGIGSALAESNFGWDDAFKLGSTALKAFSGGGSGGGGGGGGAGGFGYTDQGSLMNPYMNPQKPGKTQPAKVYDPRAQMRAWLSDINGLK